ncbi:Aldehyde dehydrogenase domain-containing protein [Caenorhabditis elegans]|uniref:Aldehyde dehydrogenase domain-containing protein n=1 Tax=Caenorhabditis elegans TaxID=6239 RepID=Q18822_CAEEL|nr:Aldehyde dehydrogenase domain-containing protein [Caenorhabditis elegans]CCD66851.1 Aldehyde dehydrogenase domain-containing protein [Caenorhabditis elegans]|eukprot:NP_509203.1 ALdehyde deHydrogenase [Caenorhabditis elegans]
MASLNYREEFKNILQKLIDSPNEQHDPLTNFIGNEFARSEKLMDSVNPSTGKPWIKIPDGTAREVDQAVEAAKEAFKTWKKTTVQQRSALLNKVANLIEEFNDDIAILESRDQGKPIGLAKVMDIPRCVQNFRDFANAALYSLSTSTILEQPTGKFVNYVKNDPVGVAGLISPWNLPLYLLSFKLAPALVAGNTVVCKPSEMTSVTAWVLMHAFKLVGFPPGVVNMVIGEGKSAGQRLVDHVDVPLISFTGSTVIGKKIQEDGAKLNKKVSLEMGGKNPGIVYSNYRKSDIASIARSSFLNQGEICLCTSRLFVQKPIFADFVKSYVEEAKKFTVGDPTTQVQIGAMNSKVHYEKVKSYIELAKKEGADILCGGVTTIQNGCENGYFITPTVIVGLHDASKVMTDEIFGPVVCITPFDTAEEVIERANSTPYGLSATVWSSDSDELLNTANELRAGTVWCNTWLARDLSMPFGGCKQSGNGREGLHDSLHFYSDAKTVCVNIAAKY